MTSIVAVVGCGTYDPEKVLAAVGRGIDLLGGISGFVLPGEKILFKPNMLAGRSPDLAVTTHPAVFEAAARVFSDAGAVPSYGDSPGYGSPKNAARKTGMAAAAEKCHAAEADFETVVQTDFPEGRTQKTFPLARGVTEADGIVSLPKMKTHGLTRITGAVKNQLGCVAGFEKARFHFRYPNPLHFSSMLVDINRLVKPRLFIMDGIVAMEGEGPSSGNPVKMGVILLSRDPVALDAVFCRLIGLDPRLVPTITEGEAAGIGTGREADVLLVGDPFAGFLKADFDVVRTPVTGDVTFQVLRRWKDRLIPRPVILSDLCKRCGICVEACPVEPRKALDWRGKGRSEPPEFDYSLCIRCYCCHEMCPHRAITIKTPLLGRIIMRILGKSTAGGG